MSLRLGVVGCGLISGKYVVNWLKAYPETLSRGRRRRLGCGAGEASLRDPDRHREAASYRWIDEGGDHCWCETERNVYRNAALVPLCRRLYRAPGGGSTS